MLNIILLIAYSRTTIDAADPSNPGTACRPPWCLGAIAPFESCAIAPFESVGLPGASPEALARRSACRSRKRCGCSGVVQNKKIHVMSCDASS